MRTLSTAEQIEKLNALMEIANNAAKSNSFIEKMGACAIYAGVIDFYAIQAARLLEEIILKAQLAVDGKTTFMPHDDSYFYEAPVGTSRILKVFRTQLPFKPAENTKTEDAEKVSIAAKKFKESFDKFLANRNILLHQIGNPAKTLIDIEQLPPRLIEIFNECIGKANEFFKLVTPFRFSEKEMKHFYGERKNAGGGQ